MKTFKKTLAILIAAVLALSVCVTALADDGYTLLPIDSSELEPGDAWFDAYKLRTDSGDYDCTDKTYYLSENGDTLKAVGNYETYYNEETQTYECPVNYYTRADAPELFDYIRVLAPFGDPLPTSSEGLADGEYWFDLDSVIDEFTQYFAYLIGEYTRSRDNAAARLAQAQADYDSYVAENPDDEDGIAERAAAVERLTRAVEASDDYLSEMQADIDTYIPAYRAATFRLSADSYVLRAETTLTMTVNGGTVTEDVTSDDTQYTSNMFWNYLRQVGVDPNPGFTLMPTADSDELAEGAPWFDVDGFVGYNGVGNEGGFYRIAKWYINDDGDILKMSLMGDVGDVSIEEDPYFFMFVHRHGEDPEDLEGYVPVVEDKVLVTDDAWFIDLDHLAGADAEGLSVAEVADRVAYADRFRESYDFFYNEDAEALKILVGSTYVSPDKDYNGMVGYISNYLYKVSLVGAVAATCTEDGYSGDLVIVRDGANVILKEGEAVGALGHAPKTTVKENEVVATCTTAGSYDEVVYCSVCEDELSRTHKTVEAKGHTWGDWTTVKEATENENGEQVRECSVCHETESRSIPATGGIVCKWCGGVHTGFMGKIVGFFHSILYFFAHLFGTR